MKFKLLSNNTILLIDEVLKNQNLLKLINYNSNTPLNNSDIVDAGSLVMKKIIPAPFSGDVPEVEETNLRVFYNGGKIKNRVILDSIVVFQIVLHNNLWNIRVDGEKKIRPYEIMNELMNTFENKSIDTVGILHFDRYFYQHISKDYGLFNLEARMMTIGGKYA